MFEIIGLFIATGIFFGLAAAVSFVLAGLVWIFTRRLRRRSRWPLIVTAVLLPIFSAVYLWLCAALLPGESLFGDISERLPNGYVLKALGKMPDFADIEYSESAWGSPKLSECVGSIVIDGQLVVGRYSHSFDTFQSKPNEPYFIFDTSTGQTTDVQTLNELQTKLGHSVQLTEVQFFRSPLAAGQRRRNATIEFGPPLTALLFLAGFVWRARRGIDAGIPTIYT